MTIEDTVGWLKLTGALDQGHARMSNVALARLLREAADRLEGKAERSVQYPSSIWDEPGSRARPLPYCPDEPHCSQAQMQSDAE